MTDITTERTAESVIDQIRRAFSEVKYPGDSQLVAPPFSDDRADVLAAFAGKHWCALDAETLRHNYEALYLLSPAGFHFFLPAFVIATLVDYRNMDPMSEAVVFRLMPRLDNPDDRAFFAERAQLFSPPQKAAVRECLRFIRDNYWDPDNRDALAESRLGVWESAEEASPVRSSRGPAQRRWHRLGVSCGAGLLLVGGVGFATSLTLGDPGHWFIVLHLFGMTLRLPGIGVGITTLLFAITGAIMLAAPVVRRRGGVHRSS